MSSTLNPKVSLDDLKKITDEFVENAFILCEKIEWPETAQKISFSAIPAEKLNKNVRNLEFIDRANAFAKFLLNAYSRGELAICFNRHDKDSLRECATAYEQENNNTLADICTIAAGP